MRAARGGMFCPLSSSVLNCSVGSPGCPPLRCAGLGVHRRQGGADRAGARGARRWRRRRRRAGGAGGQEELRAPGHGRGTWGTSNTARSMRSLSLCSKVESAAGSFLVEPPLSPLFREPPASRIVASRSQALLVPTPQAPAEAIDDAIESADPNAGSNTCPQLPLPSLAFPLSFSGPKTAHRFQQRLSSWCVELVSGQQQEVPFLCISLRFCSSDCVCLFGISSADTAVPTAGMGGRNKPVSDHTPANVEYHPT